MNFFNPDEEKENDGCRNLQRQGSFASRPSLSSTIPLPSLSSSSSSVSNETQSKLERTEAELQCSRDETERAIEKTLKLMKDHKNLEKELSDKLKATESERENAIKEIVQCNAEIGRLCAKCEELEAELSFQKRLSFDLSQELQALKESHSCTLPNSRSIEKEGHWDYEEELPATIPSAQQIRSTKRYIDVSIETDTWVITKKTKFHVPPSDDPLDDASSRLGEEVCLSSRHQYSDEVQPTFAIHSDGLMPIEEEVSGEDMEIDEEEDEEDDGEEDGHDSTYEEEEIDFDESDESDDSDQEDEENDSSGLRLKERSNFYKVYNQRMLCTANLAENEDFQAASQAFLSRVLAPPTAAKVKIKAKRRHKEKFSKAPPSTFRPTQGAKEPIDLLTSAFEGTREVHEGRTQKSGEWAVYRKKILDRDAKKNAQQVLDSSTHTLRCLLRALLKKDFDNHFNLKTMLTKESKLDDLRLSQDTGIYMYFLFDGKDGRLIGIYTGEASRLGSRGCDHEKGFSDPTDNNYFHRHVRAAQSKGHILVGRVMAITPPGLSDGHRLTLAWEPTLAFLVGSFNKEEEYAYNELRKEKGLPQLAIHGLNSSKCFEVSRIQKNTVVGDIKYENYCRDLSKAVQHHLLYSKLQHDDSFSEETRKEYQQKAIEEGQKLCIIDERKGKYQEEQLRKGTLALTLKPKEKGKKWSFSNLILGAVKCEFLYKIFDKDVVIQAAEKQQSLLVHIQFNNQEKSTSGDIIDLPSISQSCLYKGFQLKVKNPESERFGYWKANARLQRFVQFQDLMRWLFENMLREDEREIREEEKRVEVEDENGKKAIGKVSRALLKGSLEAKLVKTAATISVKHDDEDFVKVNLPYDTPLRDLYNNGVESVYIAADLNSAYPLFSASGFGETTPISKILGLAFRVKEDDRWTPIVMAFNLNPSSKKFFELCKGLYSKAFGLEFAPRVNPNRCAVIELPDWSSNEPVCCDFDILKANRNSKREWFIKLDNHTLMLDRVMVKEAIIPRSTESVNVKVRLYCPSRTNIEESRIYMSMQHSDCSNSNIWYDCVSNGKHQMPPPIFKYCLNFGKEERFNENAIAVKRGQNSR